MQSSDIHYLNSAQVAKKRLKNLQSSREENQQKDSQTRIYNSIPADNNQMWEGNHNPLSSKGD